MMHPYARRTVHQAGHGHHSHRLACSDAAVDAAAAAADAAAAAAAAVAAFLLLPVARPCCLF